MKFSVHPAVFASALLALAGAPVHAQTRMQAATATPLHTQPSAGSQQVGLATVGEILFVSRLEGDWAAIAPPDRFDLWLNQDFIEGNRVIAKSIQVRSGPGVQYDVVGMLERGAPVMPRGEDGDWRKIAPPSSATLWVRQKDLIEVRAATAPIQEVAPVPESAPAPIQAPTPTPAPVVATVEPTPASAPTPPATPPPAPTAKPVQIAASKPAAAKSATPAASRTAPKTASPPAAPAPKPVQTALAPAAGSTPAAPRATTPVLRPATALPASKPTTRPTATRPATTVRRAPTPVPAAAVPAPASAVAAQKAKTVDVEVAPALVEDLDLADLPNQGQPVQIEGQLRNAPFMAGSPSRYRLLSKSEDGVLEMTCHVHGDSAELRLYVGQEVSIRGREYWVEDSDMPVVVVGQIVPLAPASEPVMF